MSLTPSAPPSKNITTELIEAIRAHPGENIPVEELMRAMHEKGFGLLMMVLVLPNCVPIPIPPGGSTVFSIPLLFICAQMVMGRPIPWLPKWLRRKCVSQQFMLKILGVISPRLQKVEKILKPRLNFAATKAGERLVGVYWLLLSISIAVPLPMTNFLPGVGILVSALGLVGRDGYVMLTGFAIGLSGILLTALILFAGGSTIALLFS